MISHAHPTLDEHYFVSSFLNGLNEELRLTVKMLQPTIVRQAAEKARLHEISAKGGRYKGGNSQMNKGGNLPKAPIQAPPMRSLTMD